MFDPLRFSNPWKIESDGAEYFLFMQEQERLQRKEKLDKAVAQFRRLYNAGYDINEYVDEVMAAAGVADYTQEDADYVMDKVGLNGH